MISERTWSYPSKELAVFSSRRFIGNYTTPRLLTLVERLDWLSQTNLAYFCAFDEPPGGDYIRLPDCPGQAVCKNTTCCGMIDQYMMNYEYERLGLQPIVRGKEFVDEEFFAITQRNAVCLFLEEGACSIHKNKPLWCKLYVCDLMWQRARTKVCKGVG